MQHIDDLQFTSCNNIMIWIKVKSLNASISVDLQLSI